MTNHTSDSDNDTTAPVDPSDRFADAAASSREQVRQASSLSTPAPNVGRLEACPTTPCQAGEWAIAAPFVGSEDAAGPGAPGAVPPPFSAVAAGSCDVLFLSVFLVAYTGGPLQLPPNSHTEHLLSVPLPVRLIGGNFDEHRSGVHERRRSGSPISVRFITPRASRCLRIQSCTRHSVMNSQEARLETPDGGFTPRGRTDCGAGSPTGPPPQRHVALRSTTRCVA